VVDYGHPLRFGTSITPTNELPQAPVERARLSEELGFDLVTFQDHPYQPRFLDTWTLLSWVAAQTEKIHLSANVLNVPMRPAAVVGRASASLDLLSGGRFDLALGAGGFWDAMEAMGVDRLTPGQAVDALSEAIDVIRGIWAAGERSPLRIAGEHHRLQGAERGPAPAHNVPIWVGGVKPRMLRLVGHKADGWLPSLGGLQQGQLAAGQALIDDAAAEAGRDPREIRRLANITGTFSAASEGFLVGPAKQWVDELLLLALEEGLSTFILASDDPATLRRFAGEVAPALREAVAVERSSRGTAEGTVPSTLIRNRRRDGIDYDNYPASLAGATIEPGDAGYAAVRSTYLRGGSPGLVLRPRSVHEVADALAFARAQPVKLSVRSGGHGISGRSTNDGGIVIDLSTLNKTEVVDATTRRVRIEPGARWSDVAATLAPHGWALSSGDYGGVGVGGLATAGGIGWLVRAHGLTIDHLRAVDMVLADGSRVHASETENADLFWGVRGAGGNFGIVTSFEFEADEVGDVGFAQLVFDATDTAAFLQRWGAAVEAAPRDLTSFLIIGRPGPGQRVIAQVMSVVDSSDADTIIDRLQPLAATAPLLDHAIQLLPYAAILNVPPSTHDAQGEPVTRSALADHITPELANAATHLVMSGESYFFQIRSVGGAVADVAPEATAYAHRSANFQLVAFGSNRTRLDRAWDAMHHHFSGLYINFETDLRPERLKDAYPAKTLQRLQALKLRYDPDNVFRDNFNITPLAAQPGPAASTAPHQL
jgi:alkanesulfonate monooxygenase SsuD/methylene tetrahydromethanopterin reductase-like flavin-dependent oxidoreductase (luciferase family)/FAD/FMN-containing dehydrogenase